MDRRRRSYQSDQEELDSLTTLINQLSIRKQELQNRISNNTNNELSSVSSAEFVDASSSDSVPIASAPLRATTVIEPEPRRPFQIADCVFVLSNYKGRYGTVGIIKELSPKFAYIKSKRYPYRIQVQLANLEHHHE